MSHFYKKCKNLSKNAGVLGVNETQIEQTKEQGRSMVEMLGVLAIVGVLSVGAISGYRYAMNKYRANQVTNELNLLSHQVGIAMMSKSGLRGELKLGDPYDSHKMNTGYAFAAGCGESGNSDCANQSQYRFQVSGLSEDVCQELTHLAPYLQGISDFNGTCAAGENTLNFVFETEASTVGGSGANEEDPRSLCNDRGAYDTSTGLCACDTGFSGLNCAINKSCSGKGTFDETTQKCVCEESWSGPSCEFDQSCSGNGHIFYASCYCNAGYYGVNCEFEGTPENDTDKSACGASSACDNPGEYCQGYVSTNPNSCSEKQTGRCYKAKDNKKTINIASHKYVVSTIRMNWPSAKAFCEALGMNLVTKGMIENLIEQEGSSVYEMFAAKGVRGGWTGSNYDSANSFLLDASQQYLNHVCNCGECVEIAICTSEEAPIYTDEEAPIVTLPY